MYRNPVLLYKTLVIGFIILFICISVASSVGKNIEYIPTNNSLEFVNNSGELPTCEHLVYFGDFTADLFECALYKGILNDIGNSSCICLGSLVSSDFISGSTWTNDGRLLCCQYANGIIWEINIETCDMTKIGGGGCGLNGLAYDPTSDILYACSSNFLFNIDPETGEQEQIGSFNISTAMIDIAFDANGTLYGWDVKFSGESYLYKINTSTGEATIVGGMGMTLLYAQSGDFCKVDDILYLAANGCYFVECDEDTGKCTLLGQFPDPSQEITIFVIPWNFPPCVPFAPIPCNGSINVPIYINLSWNCCDPDGDNISFDVYFGTTYPPTQVASNVSGYDPGILDFDTTYYWKIVAWDEHGASTPGPIWWFTTEKGCNHPPDSPTIDGPSSGNPDVEYCFTVHSTDPDDDRVKYVIDWGDNSLLETLFNPSCVPVEVCHTWNKRFIYIIRAKALDEWGAESNWSEFYVLISRTRTTPIFVWYQWFLERFPLLGRLLNLFFYIIPTNLM